MTVEELIELLGRFDPQAKVLLGTESFARYIKPEFIHAAPVDNKIVIEGSLWLKSDNY